MGVYMCRNSFALLQLPDVEDLSDEVHTLPRLLYFCLRDYNLFDCFKVVASIGEQERSSGQC